jgi:hypothetical protein
MPVKTRTYTTLAERLKCRLKAVRSLVTGEVTTLKVRIESLQAGVAKLEATAASHRADYERERDRADRLLTELLKATANTTGAMAAKLEGEIAAVRLAAEADAGSDVMVARASLDRSDDRSRRSPFHKRQSCVVWIAWSAAKPARTR